MELITYLFWLFIGGLIIGALARLLVSGTGGLGLLATSFAGISGSLLGGLVTRYLVDPKEDWVGFAIAVVCAAAVIALMTPRGRSAPANLR